MQKAMLSCNGIQTNVITEGRWVEEGLAPSSRKDLVLVIPGNPGVPSFYEGFIKALKSRLPSEVPVWTIGHGGHVLPPANLCFSSDDENPQGRYGLNGQLQHKLAFIKAYVPKDARVHLIGHSIGAWFVLELLKHQQVADQVVKAYLLFPTIERMAETPSGKNVRNILLRLSFVLCFLAWIFTFFPTIVQEFLIRLAGLFLGYSKGSVAPIRQLLHPTVLKRVFLLVKDEIVNVRELDHELISNNEKKLWFYYGATDKWTPREYFDELKQNHPNVNAQVCRRGFRHAFVLSDGPQVGNMVGDLINETITNS